MLDRRGLLRTSLGSAIVGLGGSTAAASAQPTPASTDQTDPRVLIAFFSRPGENYYHGDRIDLEIGNTKVLVGMIGERIPCDVYEIEAAEPYSDDYDATVQRNSDEQEAEARPEIANLPSSIDDYDIILLGSPVWNVRPPRIMLTFAEAFDFTGKTIYPFTTHAMSGLGRAIGDYTASCPGATIGDGLAVLGEEVIDDPGAAARRVETWLAEIEWPAGTRMT
jgi:flavodoxin